jgi:hypothetical protein
LSRNNRTSVSLPEQRAGEERRLHRLIVCTVIVAIAKFESLSRDNFARHTRAESVEELLTERR